MSDVRFSVIKLNLRGSEARGKKWLCSQNTHRQSPKVEVHEVRQIERLAIDVASIGDDGDEVEEPTIDRKRSVFRLDKVACSLESSLDCKHY